MTIELKANKREAKTSAEQVRAAGFLPAVYYGKKEASTPIQIKKADFLKEWKEEGESNVISIDVDGAKVDALISDVAVDAVTSQPIHADFYVFEKGHKIELGVPVEFIGVSPAVKDLGGILVKVVHELKIKADPTNIQKQIEVDISSLAQFGDTIAAKDVPLPKGVELMENPEEIIATAAEPKEEKEETAPVDLSSIEVEKKGKTEEGEEAAAE